MTENRALGRRGNIKGQAIYYGRASPTITGVATTGVGSIVYSPTYDTEPYLIVGVPEMTKDSGNLLNYPLSYYLSTKSALGFAIHLWGDTAPGMYKTATFQFDYLVVGEPND